MAGKAFHKDGITRYTYKAVDAVRLHSQGWTEGKAPTAPPPVAEPEKKFDHDKEGKP